MGWSLHPILELLLLYDSLLLGPALVRLKSGLLCLPISFLQGMQGKNTCEVLTTQKTKRDSLTWLQWFWGFSTLSYGTHCCVASFSLVLFRHKFFSSYPCTSAKNHRCGNLGHCDFSQHSWQKDSWLQRSEASLNMKKALLSVFFLCKGSCSFRPQSSVSTLSWNPLLQCGLAPV